MNIITLPCNKVPSTTQHHSLNLLRTTKKQEQHQWYIKHWMLWIWKIINWYIDRWYSVLCHSLDTQIMTIMSQWHHWHHVFMMPVTGRFLPIMSQWHHWHHVFMMPVKGRFLPIQPSVTSVWVWVITVDVHLWNSWRRKCDWHQN